MEGRSLQAIGLATLGNPNDDLGVGIRDKLSARLDGIFTEADRSLQIAFTREQGRAAGSGTLHGSGYGLGLIHAFEPILTNAVKEGLVSCDLAANRPLGRRHLDLLRDRIAGAADVAAKIAAPKSDAFPNPWVPVFERELAALRERLLRLVDQHETGLAPTGAQRVFEPWWKRDAWARALFFVVGGVLAQALRELIQALMK